MKLLILIVLAVAITQVKAANLYAFPLLPAKMTEAFAFYQTESKTNTTGKVWYDSSVLSARFDFQSSTSLCQYIYPNSTDCSMLVVNQTAYVSLPSKNLCCQRATDMPIERDLLDFLSYKGEDTIDGEPFDLWYYNGAAVFPPIKYWTVKGQNRTPRRFELGKDDSYQMMDFWVNSYSENFDSKAIFAVPSNCAKACLKIDVETLEE